MNREYFISSLPYLTFGKKAPISATDFLSACESADADFARRVRSLFGGDTSVFPVWHRRVFAIVAAIVRERAQRRGVEIPSIIRNVVSAHIDEKIHAAFALSPLEREVEIARLKWSLADELGGIDAFSMEACIAYAIKLDILLHLSPPDSALGRAVFERLTSK